VRTRGRAWSIALVLAAVGGGSAVAGSAAVPGAVPDQSNPVRSQPCRYTGWVPDTDGSWAGQTFTAGVSGLLTDVVLRLRGANNQISVAIVPVDAAGAPVAPSPLSSVTVPFAPTTSFADVGFSFPSPPRVEAGKQYAVLMSVPTETPTSFIVWQYDGGSSLRDPNGTPCADGVYSGGRAWANDPSPPGPDADFFFTTDVLPLRHVAVQKLGAGGGSVQDSSGAIACGATCLADFRAAQVVTFTATPDPSSRFAGWSGACSGVSPSCSLTISADATIGATFLKKLALLSVRRIGSGTVKSRPGSLDCGRKCSARLAPGIVTLTARPATGWRFARWQGACRGIKPTCRVTLAAGRSATVTATFARKL